MFLTLMALGHQSAAAQGEKEGVRIETVTNFEIAGPIGGMIPKSETETRQITTVVGPMMRNDSGDESNIFNFSDPANPIMTVLQHPEQTFYSIALNEMQERMGAAMGGARPGQQPQWEERGEDRPEFDMEFSMNPTGRTKDFGDVPAKEVVTVVKMVPKGDAARAERSPTTAVVTRTYITTEIPGYEAILEARKKMADGFMGGGGMGAGFQQAFASDPRMRDVFEENAEKMKEMDGYPMENLLLFLTVPFGMDPDVEAALAAADEPLSEGPGMGAMAAEGARAAARDAMKNISGLLGRKNKEQEEPGEEAGPQTQTITMKYLSTVVDVTVGFFSEALFGPTDGYQEKTPEWLRRGGDL
jgi:hypothetical protein